MTSRIIHSGLLPDLRKLPATRRRLANFSFFCCEASVFIFSRISRLSASHVDFLEQFLDAFGAHHGDEFAGEFLVELALALVADHFALPQVRHFAGIDDDERFEIENALEFAQSDVEQVADAAGQALEEPDVRAGARQFDVAQAFAAHARQRDFDAALIADHAAMLHALVLAAQAFPIGDRSENAGAEQSVALRLEGPVIDGLRLGDFAMGPAPDFFRRRQTKFEWNRNRRSNLLDHTEKNGT